MKGNKLSRKNWDSLARKVWVTEGSKKWEWKTEDRHRDGDTKGAMKEEHQ